MLLHPSNFWPSAGPKHFPKKERWGERERTVGRAGKYTVCITHKTCGLEIVGFSKNRINIEI